MGRVPALINARTSHWDIDKCKCQSLTWTSSPIRFALCLSSSQAILYGQINTQFSRGTHNLYHKITPLCRCLHYNEMSIDICIYQIIDIENNIEDKLYTGT